MTATNTLIRRTVTDRQPYTRPTPVVPNNAGGPAHVIDIWARLNRFLTIGVEGGTYYVNEEKHILDNVKVVEEVLRHNFKQAIDTAVQISDEGRAVKNDYAIFLLARAASDSRLACRQYAFSKLSNVCRTGSHLLQFVAMVDTMRGWGPGLRKAIANWYLSKDAQQAAFQMLKYQNREGWTHRDVLRKVHPQTTNRQMNNLFKFMTTQKYHYDFIEVGAIPELVRLYSLAQKTTPSENDMEFLAHHIRNSGLQREMIPTQHLTNPIVAEALAEKMPYTAMLRNLGNLTRYGVLRTEHIMRLADPTYIHKSRVHPISILLAMRTYAQGGGYRSRNTWYPLRDVESVLDIAFYESFKNVQPTGKRFLVGVDVSASMGSDALNTNLTHSEVAAALALQWARTEPWVQVFGFDTNLIPLKINAHSTLKDAIRAVQPFNYGGTDCAKLIQFALDNRIDTDVFVVITDNETNGRGRRNPAEVLREYRRVMNNPDAKLVVLATAATKFSIADPNDKGMMDISGFDSAVPQIISQFVTGQI